MTDYKTLKIIIEQQKLFTLLHPIISIKEKRVIGFEALSRGINPETRDIISPIELFESAFHCNMSLKLDRLCREKAVKTFADKFKNSDYMLFLNFDPSILDQVIIGNGWLKNLVSTQGVKPGNLAIEIVESSVESQSLLKKFVNLYRNYGFVIVLDDFGAQHSNLDRILQLKPDIIKIDRELVENVSQDYYKQSIVGSIISLANKIGTLVLAEGVEKIEDIIKCYELGADLFQGYHFSRPACAEDFEKDFCNKKISQASDQIFTYLNSRITQQISSQEAFETIGRELCSRMKNMKPETFDHFLKDNITRFEQVQCMYILDKNGKQVSNTIFRLKTVFNPRHTLFKPAVKGTDHSLKNYF